MKYTTLASLLSLIWLWLSFAAATTTGYYDTKDVSAASTTTSTELSNIALRLYAKNTIGEYESVLVGDAVKLMHRINSSKPTVFYIFGWTETPESESVAVVVGAYLKRDDHNVILIDWQYIAAAQFYPKVVLSAKRVGKTVAKAIDEMVAAGLNSSTIHIIGHSLGSPIAGYIGRNVKHALPRITGLDPAGPGFYLFFTPLTSTDANFVDIIHTDAGAYGTAANRGAVNFFPNGGHRVQPGCPTIFVPFDSDDFCSHHRSWYYYAESLLNEDAFVGVSCDSYDQFKSGSCSNETMTMGYATPTTATGNFYLQTNGSSPYGREAAGTTYEAWY